MSVDNAWLNVSRQCREKLKLGLSEITRMKGTGCFSHVRYMAQNAQELHGDHHQPIEFPIYHRSSRYIHVHEEALLSSHEITNTSST
eukprot:scaffold3805_cov103-Skeletonema_dohrnii-CCMP3373.AAC.1